MRKTRLIMGLTAALLLASCGGSSSSSSAVSESSSEATSESSKSDLSSEISSEIVSEASSEEASESSEVVSSEVSSEEDTGYEALATFAKNLANGNQTDTISANDTEIAKIQLLGESGYLQSYIGTDYDYDTDEFIEIAVEEGVVRLPGYGYFDVSVKDGTFALGDMAAKAEPIENIASYLIYSSLDLVPYLTEETIFEYFEISDEDDNVLNIALDSPIPVVASASALGFSTAKTATFTSATLTLEDGGDAGTFSLEGSIEEDGEEMVFAFDLRVDLFGETVSKTYENILALELEPAGPSSLEETYVPDYLDQIWGEDRAFGLPDGEFSAGFQLNTNYVYDQNTLGILDLGLSAEGVDAYEVLLLEDGWTLVEEESDAAEHDYYLRRLLDETANKYATASLALVLPDEGSTGSVLYPDGYFVLALSTWVEPIVVSGFEDVVNYLDAAYEAGNYLVPSLTDDDNVVTDAVLNDYTYTYIDMGHTLLHYSASKIEIAAEEDANAFVSAYVAKLLEAGFEYEADYNDYALGSLYITFLTDADKDDAYDGYLTLYVQMDDVYADTSTPDAANALIEAANLATGHAIPTLPESDLPTKYEVEDNNEWAEMLDLLSWFYVYVYVDEENVDAYVELLVKSFADAGWKCVQDETSGDYTFATLDGNAAVGLMKAGDVDDEGTFVYSGYLQLSYQVAGQAVEIDDAYINDLLAQLDSYYETSTPEVVGGEVTDFGSYSEEESDDLLFYVNYTYESEEAATAAKADYIEKLVAAGFVEEEAGYVNAEGSLHVTIVADGAELLYTFSYTKIVKTYTIDEVNTLLAEHATAYGVTLPTLPETEAFTVYSVADNEVQEDGSLPVFILFDIVDLEATKTYVASYVAALEEAGYVTTDVTDAEDEQNVFSYKIVSSDEKCTVEIDLYDYGEDIGSSMMISYTFAA